MKTWIWEPIYVYREKHNTLKDADYQIFGIYYQLRRLKDRIHDYKLRHLSLGKVVYEGRPFEKNAFRIEGISWDISWMTDLYLAVIIRDYLRYHSLKTPAIGNCILRDNTEGVPFEDFLYKNVNNGVDYSKRWRDKVNEVADEFDELIRMMHTDSTDNNFYLRLQEMTDKAFKDLAYIFNDLSW